MKFMIVPAKELQSGDVVFTNNGEGTGVQFCVRVFAQSLSPSHPDISEYRVEVVVGTEESPEGSHTTIGFRHATPLGVAREDEHASVDVAALLNELDGKKT